MVRKLRVVLFATSLPVRQGVRVIKILREWRADWMLSGRSPHTIDNYQYVLASLLTQEPDLDAWDLPLVKEWIAGAASDQRRRMRARAVKAFLRWADEEEVLDAGWYKRIKLPNVTDLPQATATEEDYRHAMARAHAYRDRALLAVLWSSGVRREELTRMRVEHVDLDGGNVLVPVSKTKRHRVAPLSPEAVKLLRVYLRKHPQIGDTGPLWIGTQGPLSAQGIRGVLRRLGAPTPHSFRRGWAVESLKAGVSQTSVQAAAGWSSGAMVSRYTRALAGELAIEEFNRRWAS
jgi:integrase/recombinase XerD